MKTMLFRATATLLVLAVFALPVFSVTAVNEFLISDYYPIADGNEWRYKAPSGWKDGDYISRIVLDRNNFASTYSIDPRWDSATVGETTNTFKHFDATNAAKLLRVEDDGIHHIGEELSGSKSFVIFDRPILWLPNRLKLDTKLDEKRGFTQRFSNGRSSRGSYRIVQEIKGFEAVKTGGGKFENALRIDSETYWELGDGRKAKSINRYHYAKNVGVVRASARFIIVGKDGKELINRLIETDIKSYKLN